MTPPAPGLACLAERLPLHKQLLAQGAAKLHALQAARKRRAGRSGSGKPAGQLVLGADGRDEVQACSTGRVFGWRTKASAYSCLCAFQHSITCQLTVSSASTVYPGAPAKGQPMATQRPTCGAAARRSQATGAQISGRPGTAARPCMHGPAKSMHQASFMCKFKLERPLPASPASQTLLGGLPAGSAPPGPPWSGTQHPRGRRRSVERRGAAHRAASVRTGGSPARGRWA